MIETILVATDGSDAAAPPSASAWRSRPGCVRALHGVTVIEDRFTHGLRADGLGVPPPAHGRRSSRSCASAPRACRARARGRSRAERARVQGRDAARHRRRPHRRARPAGRPDRARARRPEREVPHRADRLDRRRRAPQDQQARARRAGAAPSSAARSCSGSTARRARASPRSSRSSSPARLEQPIHCFVDSKDKGRAVARFDEVRAARRRASRCRCARRVDARASRREDRRHGARGAGRADRDGRVRPQPHQRVLPREQRRRGRCARRPSRCCSRADVSSGADPPRRARRTRSAGASSKAIRAAR